MEPTSEAGARLLDAVADASDRMVRLSQRLGKCDPIKCVRRVVDVRRYESGAMLEMCVDAELKNGKGLVLGLDVRRDESAWIVDSYVRINDDQGQMSVLEFPERRSAMLSGLLRDLDAAVSSLEMEGVDRGLAAC